MSFPFQSFIILIPKCFHTLLTLLFNHPLGFFRTNNLLRLSCQNCSNKNHEPCFSCSDCRRKIISIDTKKPVRVGLKARGFLWIKTGKGLSKDLSLLFHFMAIQNKQKISSFTARGKSFSICSHDTIF